MLPLLIPTIFWMAVFLFSIKGQRHLRAFEILGWMTSAVSIIGGVATSFVQSYTSLQASPFGTYLLDPSVGFFGTAVERRLTSIAVDGAAALVVAVAFALLARKTVGLVLSYRDARFLGMGSLMIGWPNVLLFLFMTFVIAGLAMAFLHLRGAAQRGDRIRILPYVSLAAVLTLWLGPLIAAWSGLSVIEI